jgi:hypothetical protein
MFSLRVLFVTAAFLTGGTSLLAAQAEQPRSVDSTVALTPNLSGTWVMTSRFGPSVVANFEHKGGRLEVKFIESARCGQTQVTIRWNLWGFAEGRHVELRAGDSRIDGNSQNPCNDIPLLSDVRFIGTISEDGKVIKGPYDTSRLAAHVWTFRRK